MKRKGLLIGIMLLSCLASQAQDWKRTQNWYFGDSAGLSFIISPPFHFTNGSMLAWEGCATISDTNGDLLFYTNGMTIWNKNHLVMANGDSLYGNYSSTQSALIIPQPGNDSIYFIFTTDALGLSKGLQYSVANLKRQNGLGEVMEKNTLLHTPVCEKLAATFHQNGRDIWLLAHKWNSNQFLAYLITSKGLVECPVLSSIGSFHGGASIADAQGTMKFSSNGKALAISVFGKNQVEVLSFNNSNGLLAGNVLILNNILLPYGIDFAKNGSVLYVTDKGKNLYQYNLERGHVDSIRNNRKTISTHLTEVFQSVQLANDGKVYVANRDSAFLSVINSPDSIGDSARFIYMGQSLSPKKSKYGLPNFVSSYFYRPALDIGYETECQNDTIHFEARSESIITSPSWDIIRNGSSTYSSSQLSFRYGFNDTGEYSVRLISGLDTVIKTIYIETKLELGADTILCNQDALEISIPNNFRCIQWQDGTDSHTYTISQSGEYYLSTYNIKGCLVSDTVHILFTSISQPVITRSGDSLLTDSGAYTYKWIRNGIGIPGSMNAVRVLQAGSYQVEITDSNGCKSLSDAFNVSILSVDPVVNKKFIVFPNPSQEGSGVHLEGDEIIMNIKVYDLVGKLIYTRDSINQYQYTINCLLGGVYIINVNGANNYKIMIE